MINQLDKPTFSVLKVFDIYKSCQTPEHYASCCIFSILYYKKYRYQYDVTSIIDKSFENSKDYKFKVIRWIKRNQFKVNDMVFPKEPTDLSFLRD